MRNLKRALSLILAAAMLIGMMVVGASAVSYNDFPDRDEIVNKDAVSMLTTLGIIEGTDQGTYNPTGDVDRAQMAKMISVALTNNEDCDTLYQNVNSGLTDITANWARGYINYCYVRGIIAGRGDNTFDPSANVTGVEAAKMLLTALGYDASIEGLVGNDWALNTAALAQNLGIFRNFTKDVSEPLNRDDAALLIYNALDVELIQEYRNGYAISYDDHRTILSSVFGVIRVEGVVIGNEWAQLEETDSDAALQEGRTRLENVVWYDSTTANTVVDEGVRETQPVTFNVTTPVDMMGKAVTLYVEKTTILSNSVVIGWTPNDNLNNVVSNASNKSTAKDLLDGTGVAVDNNTQYYVNYGYETRTDAIELVNDYKWSANGGRFDLNGVEVEVIDNDDDGTAEYVLYVRETLSNVVRTSSRDETTTINVPVVDGEGLLTDNSPVTTTEVLDNADIVTEMELAADDLILYVQYGGRTYITAPETVIDTMTRVDRDRNNEQYITLSSGETYRASYIREVLSQVDADVTRFEFNNTATTAEFDTNYEWILDSNGYIVDFRPAEEAVRNLGLVLDSAWTQNALRRSGELKILDASGIENTYTINWNASRDAFDETGSMTNSDLDTALENYLGTRDVNAGDNDPYYNLGAARGTVIEYTLNEAGDTLTITNVFNLNQLAANDATNLGLVTPSDADKDDISIDVISEDIAYMEDNANGYTSQTMNLQYTLDAAYQNNGGNLYVEYQYGTPAVTDTKTYAVDRNTVAFYYDVVERADIQRGGRYYGMGYAVDDVLYGVATGWEQMCNVPAGVQIQVYPVITKQGGQYAASNLADVVLFNYAQTNDTTDWMLVLNANAVNSSTLELNVVFEDGTTDVVELDRDDYSHFYNNNNAYMKAYRYSVNANGEYTVNVDSEKDATYASLLRDGTVDTGDATLDYLTITGDSHIWDVTDVDSAEDEVTTGSFDYLNEKHAVIIPTNNNKTIKTAWVWDMDGDSPVGSNCTFNWNATGFTPVYVDATTAWWAWSQIDSAFDAGENVVLYLGNAGTLPFDLNIPADRIVQVQGDLNNSDGNVHGNGTLRVTGTFSANDTIDVTTYAGNLTTANNIAINDDVHVQNKATLGSSDIDASAIRIGSGVHVCARGTVAPAMEINDDVTNSGHIETNGMEVNNGATVTDLSTNSIVVNGDIVLNGGSQIVVGGTSAGNVTVVGGTITDGTTGLGHLNVANGTVTLRNSSIDLDNTGSTVTVGASGTIRQSNSSIAQNVMADAIYMNGGTVDIRGDLVANTRLEINGNATVRADEVNTLPGNSTLLIDDEATVTADIAQGVTGRPDGNGNVIYDGNYTETVTDPDTGANWLANVEIGNLATVDVSKSLTASVTLPNGTYTDTTVKANLRENLEDTYTIAYYCNNNPATVDNVGKMNLSKGGTVTIDVINRDTSSRQTYTINVTVASAADTHTLTVTEGEGIANVAVSGNGVAGSSNTYSFLPGTQITIEVETQSDYTLGDDAVTYTVTGQQGTNTLPGTNGTYTLDTTSITGDVRVTATGTYVAKTPTVTKVTVNEAYKIDGDADVVAEVTSTDAAGATILVSKLPTSAEVAMGYVTGKLLNVDGEWATLEAEHDAAASTETTYVVTVTLPAADARDKDQTFTLTFEKISDADKPAKDVPVINAALENMEISVSAIGGDALKTALQDELDAVKTWGSDVTVESCRLANGESHNGGTKSVQLTYTINVGNQTISATSYITVTVNTAP